MSSHGYRQGDDAHPYTLAPDDIDLSAPGEYEGAAELNEDT